MDEAMKVMEEHVYDFTKQGYSKEAIIVLMVSIALDNLQETLLKEIRSNNDRNITRD